MGKMCVCVFCVYSLHYVQQHTYVERKQYVHRKYTNQLLSGHTGVHIYKRYKEKIGKNRSMVSHLLLVVMT